MEIIPVFKNGTKSRVGVPQNKICSVFFFFSSGVTQKRDQGGRDHQFFSSFFLQSPLQGYTESNRDGSTGKLFAPLVTKVALVLLAQLVLTIKSLKAAASLFPLQSFIEVLNKYINNEPQGR